MDFVSKPWSKSRRVDYDLNTFGDGLVYSFSINLHCLAPTRSYYNVTPQFSGFKLQRQKSRLPSRKGISTVLITELRASFTLRITDQFQSDNFFSITALKDTPFGLPPEDSAVFRLGDNSVDTRLGKTLPLFLLVQQSTLCVSFHLCEWSRLMDSIDDEINVEVSCADLSSFFIS